MNLREEIVADIQTLPETVLPKLRETIIKLREDEEKPGLLRRLQKIKITDAPSDFSRNIDLYLSGEKSID
ncbi:MAG: hypothetical protein ABI954_07075 [Pyrinomonadaceae bacterium]